MSEDQTRRLLEALPTDVLRPPGVAPISAFVGSGLAESIDRALQGVDEGHGNVTIDLNSHDGIKGMVVHRVNGVWSVAAATTWHFHGKPEAEVAIRGTW